MRIVTDGSCVTHGISCSTKVLVQERGEGALLYDLTEDMGYEHGAYVPGIGQHAGSGFTAGMAELLGICKGLEMVIEYHFYPDEGTRVGGLGRTLMENRILLVSTDSQVARSYLHRAPGAARPVMPCPHLAPLVQHIQGLEETVTAQLGFSAIQYYPPSTPQQLAEHGERDHHATAVREARGPLYAATASIWGAAYYAAVVDLLTYMAGIPR